MTLSNDSKPAAKKQRTPATIPFGQKIQRDTKWLKDLESQRQRIFDALFTMIDDDQPWCDAYIEQAQSDPDALMHRCVKSGDEVAWTLHPPRKKHYKEHLKEHKEACLQHIAFLTLVIHDLHTLQSFNANPSFNNAPQWVILPPHLENEALLWVTGSLAQASEHLAAVRMLTNKDRYLSARQSGGRSHARVLEENDEYSVVRPLVKILLQGESKRQRGGADQELIERYVTSIMALWKSWPFFHFNRDALAKMVKTILKDLNVTEERKKSLFERRRRTPMARPQRFSRSTEFEAQQNEAWQGGLVTALMHILETSFGRIDEVDQEKIEAASPEQLGIWLCRTHKAKSQDEVLRF